jgi:glycosyltransferase involved in cell wall biosynthesis
LFVQFTQGKTILHLLLTITLGVAAFIWAVQSVRAGVGMRRLPHIENFAPLAKNLSPKVSIVFAARDEAEKLPGALQTLLALDYPNYEVIAVDDRSADSTGAILDDFARRDPRLRVLHITDLPRGWLGKPHALNCAFQISTGSWLIFTDADVHFAPDVVGRAMAVATQQSLDHFTLFAGMTMVGFWERVVLTYFALGFTLGIQAWRVNDPRSPCYVGIGAFQLIKREVLEAIGGHRRLAMEVVEDMKLGKLVKLGGFRSQVGYSERHLSVRWHAGLRNLIRGTTKNFFATTGFRVSLAMVQISGIILMSVVPWIALLWFALAPFFNFPRTSSLTLAFGIAAVGIALLFHAKIASGAKSSPLYGLTHPLGALLFAWMLARSTFVTLWRGGIVWRDTFYPLADLRRGSV